MTLLKLITENKYVTIGDLKSLVGRLEFYHTIMGSSGKFVQSFIISTSIQGNWGRSIDINFVSWQVRSTHVHHNPACAVGLGCDGHGADPRFRK